MIGCLIGSLAYLAGCPSALGLETPVLDQPDAAMPMSGDVANPDSPIDAAPACPPAPAGCSAFACVATDSCYYACTGDVSWIAAQSYCSQIASASNGSATNGSATNGSATNGSLMNGSPMNGCLATIGGELEQQCVVAATQPTGSDPVWIGLYQLDAAHEPADGWQWTCGAGEWRAWASFEPYDLVGDRDCAELGAGGGWKADVCAYSRRFVCKVALR